MNDETLVIDSPDPLASEGPAPSGGRHPVNIAHLVMGLAFAGLLAIWTLVVTEAVPNDDLRWLLPVPWILGGGIGLVAVVVSNRRHRR